MSSTPSNSLSFLPFSHPLRILYYIIVPTTTHSHIHHSYHVGSCLPLCCLPSEPSKAPSREPWPRGVKPTPGVRLSPTPARAVVSLPRGACSPGGDKPIPILHLLSSLLLSSYSYRHKHHFFLHPLSPSPFLFIHSYTSSFFSILLGRKLVVGFGVD
jgi:hypothetical protein